MAGSSNHWDGLPDHVRQIESKGLLIKRACPVSLCRRRGAMWVRVSSEALPRTFDIMVPLRQERLTTPPPHAGRSHLGHPARGEAPEEMQACPSTCCWCLAFSTNRWWAAVAADKGCPLLLPDVGECRGRGPPGRIECGLKPVRSFTDSTASVGGVQLDVETCSLLRERRSGSTRTSPTRREESRGGHASRSFPTLGSLSACRFPDGQPLDLLLRTNGAQRGSKETDSVSSLAMGLAWSSVPDILCLCMGRYTSCRGVTGRRLTRYVMRDYVNSTLT